MVRKVKEYLSTCTWEDIFNICVWKIPIIVFVVIIVIVSGKITIERRWVELFTYPEEEYQALENEAISMVENQTFDTEYHCNIKSMDNRSDDVSFELRSNSASIDVKVTNYKKDSQRVETERIIKNKGWHIFCGIALIFIIIPFVFASCVSVALGSFWCIVGGILKLFEFIMDKIEK